MAGQGNHTVASDTEVEAESQALLADPGLLRKYVQAAHIRGLVGEDRNLATMKLALTSRSLDRPVNVAVKGPSGSGKNHLVEAALALEDPSAYYELNTASERYLAYATDIDLRHRMVYMPEAAGMGGWGPVGHSIMRSLTWSNRVSLGTVDRGAKGLQARRLEREGPTGLIVTLTGHLEPELETRILSLEVGDTADQTRAILKGISRNFNGSTPTLGQEPVWHALSRICAEPHRVSIPFAAWLADKVPAFQVRARRDFRQMLSLIAASSIFHRVQRPSHGESVVASIVDYAIVSELSGDWFAASQAGGLTPSEEEAVNVVRTRDQAPLIAPTTYTVVAQELDLDVSAARRRLQRPLAMGIVVNEQQQAHRPAHLVPGEAATSVPKLPDPEELLKTFPDLGGSWVDPLSGELRHLP